MITTAIGQIMDKDTFGTKYLENYKGEVIDNSGLGESETFTVEIMEFENGVPFKFLEQRDITLDLTNLGTIQYTENVEVVNPETLEITIVENIVQRSKTIREALSELI
jgi:hypothetical protein